jgi:O-acetylhomoserine/O-acetylserine sulfhydrylase-like pyridoxal-dependent enzyme
MANKDYSTNMQRFCGVQRPSSKQGHTSCQLIEVKPLWHNKHNPVSDEANQFLQQMNRVNGIVHCEMKNNEKHWEAKKNNKSGDIFGDAKVLLDKVCN